MPMRVILATILVAGGLAVALIVVVPARAEPGNCPPICDQIPETAWISPRAVPLDSTYHWPTLAGRASVLTGTLPRLKFEDVCATPPARDDRVSSVASRVTVVHPDGQWAMQAEVLHWRGDTARGGQLAAAVFNSATSALRGCQLGAPQESPSVTADAPNRLAAVVSGPVIMHSYLVAHVASSTVTALTLWSSGPPQVSWPSISDDAVLDALTAPLCEAYIASCP
jgi:hypothetical protein